jgi:hypothetical protein
MVKPMSRSFEELLTTSERMLNSRLDINLVSIILANKTVTLGLGI